jgi:hypothetical protein
VAGIDIDKGKAKAEGDDAKVRTKRGGVTRAWRIRKAMYVKKKVTVTRSRNNCSRGKAISTTYSVCVYVCVCVCL